MRKQAFLSKLSILIILLGLMSFTTADSVFHSFIIKDIDGKDFDFASLKGKKVMVVNVASKCGFTPQYEELQALYKKYGGEKFEIIAFPANDFLKQEPGTDSEIKNFCSSNYQVTFKMMSKISVVGKDMAPIYEWLTQKSLNGYKDSKVSWNFQKFLIDENGKLVNVLSPSTKPNDLQIIAWLEAK
jgi:glutathione peroxidase